MSVIPHPLCFSTLPRYACVRHFPKSCIHLHYLICHVYEECVFCSWTQFWHQAYMRVVCQCDSSTLKTFFRFCVVWQQAEFEPYKHSAVHAQPCVCVCACVCVFAALLSRCVKSEPGVVLTCPVSSRSSCSTQVSACVSGGMCLA